MLNQKMKPIAAAVGTAFVASLATTGVAQADDNLFVAADLELITHAVFSHPALFTARCVMTRAR